MLTTYQSKGYRPTTMQELENVPITDRGRRTDRWQGVQHADLVRSMQQGFENMGMVPKETRLSLQATGAGLVGAFLFDTPEALRIEDAPDMDLSCGFVHSNDSRRALHGAVGANVSVCGNGMCTGEFVWSRKHTNRLEIDEWVRMGIERFTDSLVHNREQIAALVETYIHSTQANTTLVQLGRKKVLSWKRVGQVDEMWRNPPHEEFRDRTAFNFYQAFNEVVKEVPMQQQFTKLRQGFQVVKDICLN